ncbi:hypothetical protein [Granulicella sp. L46]|jgi:hypothetical protein|nr:hypothetical protein [Granulicella sp. L46]
MHGQPEALKIAKNITNPISKKMDGRPLGATLKCVTQASQIT